jgi:hypothetical protein
MLGIATETAAPAQRQAPLPQPVTVVVCNFILASCGFWLDQNG